MGARERSASEFKQGPSGAGEEEATERGVPGPWEVVGPRGGVVSGVGAGRVLTGSGAVWGSRF